MTGAPVTPLRGDPIRTAIAARRLVRGHCGIAPAACIVSAIYRPPGDLDTFTWFHQIPADVMPQWAAGALAWCNDYVAQADHHATAAAVADLVDRWHVLDAEAWRLAGIDLRVRLLRLVSEPGPHLERALGFLVSDTWPSTETAALVVESATFARAEFSAGRPFGEAAGRAYLVVPALQHVDTAQETDAYRIYQMMKLLPVDDSPYRAAPFTTTEAVVATVLGTLEQWISTQERP